MFDMLSRLKPSFFHGAAAAALCGLACGLALRTGWQSHDTAPQLLFSSAAAAELKRPASPDDAQPADDGVAAAQQAQADALLADSTPLREEYAPATPLPLTRLAPAPEPEARDAGVDADRAPADEADETPTN